MSVPPIIVRFEKKKKKTMFAAARSLLKHSRAIATKGLVTALPSAAPRSALLLSQTARALSSAVANQPTHITLAETLAAELLHEQAEIDVDEDYEEVKALVSKSFKITDKPGYGTVSLERNYKGEHIVITFDCQDTIEDVEDESKYADFENQEEVQLGEDDNVPTKFGINFEVIITKTKSKAIFYCASTEDRVVIQNITFVPVDVEDTKAYSGPRYEDLDETLREAFQNYLTERKIDEDLAFYILSEARHKEEREYKNWLVGLSEFYAK